MHLFYRLTESDPLHGFDLPGSFSGEFWAPGWFRLRPRGLKILPYATWSLLHLTGCFANRDFRLYLIREGDRIAHLSAVIPGSFRFPFMGSQDLQIGSTWTHPEYQRRGLATAAASTVIAQMRGKGRAFWYFTDSDNPASVRVAQRVGFVRVGTGHRVNPLGLRWLGHWVVSEASSVATEPGR